MMIPSKAISAFKVELVFLVRGQFTDVRHCRQEACQQAVNDKAATESGPETSYFPCKEVYPQEHGSRPAST